MWKAVLAGTAAVVITSSGLLFAQQASAPVVLAHEGRSDEDGQRWHPSAEDMSAFTDARIAALKAGLRLTPDQEKNWPAFESATRDMVKARAERMAARENQQSPTDPIERLARRADRLASVAEHLKKLAAAAEPLYKSLDDAQKHRFRILVRALRPHYRMHFASSEGPNWCGHGDHGDWHHHSEGMGPNNRRFLRKRALPLIMRS
jgi:hypothetical protein